MQDRHLPTALAFTWRTGQRLASVREETGASAAGEASLFQGGGGIGPQAVVAVFFVRRSRGHSWSASLLVDISARFSLEMLTSTTRCRSHEGRGRAAERGRRRGASSRAVMQGSKTGCRVRSDGDGPEEVGGSSAGVGARPCVVDLDLTIGVASMTCVQRRWETGLRYRSRRGGGQAWVDVEKRGLSVVSSSSCCARGFKTGEVVCVVGEP